MNDVFVEMPLSFICPTALAFSTHINMLTLFINRYYAPPLNTPFRLADGGIPLMVRHHFSSYNNTYKEKCSKLKIETHIQGQTTALKRIAISHRRLAIISQVSSSCGPREFSHATAAAVAH